MVITCRVKSNHFAIRRGGELAYHLSSKVIGIHFLLIMQGLGYVLCCANLERYRCGIEGSHFKVPYFAFGVKYNVFAVGSPAKVGVYAKNGPCFLLVV